MSDWLSDLIYFSNSDRRIGAYTQRGCRIG